MPKKQYLQSKKKHGLSSKHSYNDLLQELKSILAKGQYTAYRAVDNIRVQTYWQLGERIVREELKNKERADYGKILIADLAKDLGVSKRLLYVIVRFYRACPIVQTLSAQLSWSHYFELIEINNNKVRVFLRKQDHPAFLERA